MNRSYRSYLLLSTLVPLAWFGTWLINRHDETLAPRVKILPNQPTPVPTAVRFEADPDAEFVNKTKSAGLNYRWTIPGPRPVDILQGIGNGCAFLDYDNDNNLDVLLVGPRLALFRGDGRGHFRDVSRQMQLSHLKGNFLGCAVGDYDNDGYDDIYISAYRSGILLRNDHARRFVDVSQTADLPPQPWGTSCAFSDVDNDGKLDLYVGNYVQFDRAKDDRQCALLNFQKGSCPPNHYTPEQGVFFRNLGGKFKNVSAQWCPKPIGFNLGVAFADYDDSGHQSAFFANDEIWQELMKNTGSGLKDVARAAGTNTNHANNTFGGMGVDWGDFNNDGRLDVTDMAFQGEPKCIFQNLGDGLFEEKGEELGLKPALDYVAFGVKWLDFNNDGWLDLMIANGHVWDNTKAVNPTTTYRQPTLLFRNDKGQSFHNIDAGADFHKPIVGRGLAVGDYDNDGRLDALVVDAEGEPLLLHNETRRAGHWISLRLSGTKSNRNAYGAKVTVIAGKKRLSFQCHSDGSYFSASDSRVHAGLGAALRVDEVQIRWPSGARQTFKNLPVDSHYALTEGVNAAR